MKTRRSSRSTFAVASLALSAVWLAAAADAAHAKDLKWKFKEGEALNYVMERSIETAFKIGGNSIAVNAELKFDVAWKTKSVADDGSADVEVTVERVQLQTKIPLGNTPVDINLDSALPETMSNPLVLGAMPGFGLLPGETFVLTVSPAGEVSEVKFPEKLTKFFDEQKQEKGQGGRGQGRGRRGGGMPGMDMFNEQGIREVLAQAVMPLSKEAVEPGGTWKQTKDTEQPGAGVQTNETTYTYVGPVEEDGRTLEKIEGQTEMFFEPAEDASIDVEIGEQEGKAVFLFDAEAGHVTRVEGNSKFVKEMVSPQGEFSQSLAETFVMRIGKSPAPEKKPETKSEKSEKKSEKTE